MVGTGGWEQEAVETQGGVRGGEAGSSRKRQRKWSGLPGAVGALATDTRLSRCVPSWLWVLGCSKKAIYLLSHLMLLVELSQQPSLSSVPLPGSTWEPQRLLRPGHLLIVCPRIGCFTS